MKYFTILLFLSLLACTPTPTEQANVDHYAHIQDTKAREIIRASIAHAGGLEAWNKIERLRYSKNFDLYSESGEVEKRFEQLHDYHYHPSLYLDILSVENGVRVHTTLDKGKYQRTQNDTLVEKSQAALAKAMNTSTYVIGMPFKLLDEGAAISYAGEIEFKGETVDVIQVKYNAKKHKNHSSSETWKYYFDKKDSKILGYWVQSSDHFNIVENLSFERVGGILWLGKRKSYRVDSLGNRLYVRADYAYGNYIVE